MPAIPDDTVTPTDSRDACTRMVAALARSLAEAPSANGGAADVLTLETHLSWVVLAGDDAWKIKKPVAFDFVDFSTLARRKRACDEELKLNRRYSSAIYRAVVPVVGAVDAPRLAITTPAAAAATGESASEPIEYAVWMKRFDQQSIFSRMIEQSRLGADRVDELAELVAGQHDRAAALAITDEAGTSAVVRQQIEQVMDGIAASIGEERVASLRTRLMLALDQSLLALDARRSGGFVRECHADLHLSNICVHRGQVAVFDCLEFDPLLRQIDVMADLAFIVADLLAWHRSDLASRLLNHYLTITGDHGGLRVLRLYVAYRALVRARVGLLSGKASKHAPGVDDYLGLAQASMAAGHPVLAIVHGPSGSGKSFVAARLCSTLPLIWLRSDVERKRLLGLAPQARTAAVPEVGGPGGAYGAAHSHETYQQLAVKAAQAVSAGYSVIVDATFQRKADRQRFCDLARSIGAAFVIVEVRASTPVMRERIRQRIATGSDASEADEAVLDRQLDTFEPLDEDERIASVDFDNSPERTASAFDTALAPVLKRLQDG